MQKPQTKKEEVFEELHGLKIADPYRWLENWDDPAVKQWTTEQNEYMASFLKNEKFEVFSRELKKYSDVTIFSNPTLVNGKYFYNEKRPGQDQQVVYMKNGLDGEPVTLIDPNGMKAGNTISLDYYFPSATAKYLAYGMSEDGDEASTLYVKEIGTNQILVAIPNCRYSNVCWLPDDSGFFYTANARPGTVVKEDECMYSKVYFHKMGDDPQSDALIFGAGRGKDDMIELSLSLDGRYLGIGVSQEWTENDVFIYDAQVKELKPLVVGVKATFYIHFCQEKVFLVTNYKAPNSRILWAPLNDFSGPLDAWQEFVAETQNNLESVSFTKSKILLNYLENVSSKVLLVDYDGRSLGQLDLPEFSVLLDVSNSRREEEFFYGVDSNTFPKISYRYNPETQKSELFRQTESPVNPDDYEVKQLWFKSNDGANVPMFVTHKKGLVLNGQNPTILYGYGGFGINMTPAFRRHFVPWLERGGVFAVANIRGGGEFGEAWHVNGILMKKQNGFDDFIAAAEFLIAEKYTDSKHLGIYGGSNGGMLVNAVMTQKPDLFAAVCSQVPLADMVRFHKFGMAIRWMSEYGNPDVKLELENILKWSPYHNVKAGVKYPRLFLVTAEKDTRVEPFHARKMAAMIQAANPQNKALLFTEPNAGHSAGKPISKVVELSAMVLSFFSSELGLMV